ncbi:hypothetical protein BKA66DRAFT_480006, partial [Pyrenochaeta sp. MPI-SDFR-AT-0127]
MRVIYRNARKVLIWLGHPDKQTNAALTLIDQIAGRCRARLVTDVANFNRNYYFPEDFVKSAETVHLDSTQIKQAALALAAFFDRPWFERVWVIQEVGNAQIAQVMIGDHERPWNNIGLAAAWIVSQPQGASIVRHSTTHGPRNALFMCGQDFKVDSRVPHLAVFQSARNFNATDPRDKVNALLNQPLAIRSNYYDVFQRYYQPGLSLMRHILTVAFWVMLRFIIPGNWFPWFILREAVFYISGSRLSAYIVKILSSTAAAAPVQWFTYVPPEGGVRLSWDTLRSIYKWLSQPTWLSTTPSTLLSMNADYQRSIAEINRLVATRTVENFQRVDFLSYVHHDGDTIDESEPSWIPQWQRHTGTKSILSSFTTDPYAADSPHGFPQKFSPSIENGQLSLCALQIGAITQVSDIMHSSQFNDAAPPIVQQILNHHGQDRDIYGPTGVSAKEACILTLTASQALTTLRTDNSPKAVFQRMLETTDGTHFDGHDAMNRFFRMVTANRKYALRQQRNHEVASSVCHMRRHFVTNSGHQGIGTAQTQPGDTLFVVVGSLCPLVLRQYGRNVYKLVGECYAHGLMDGE